MEKIAGPFGTFPHSYVVYKDKLSRKPYAVGRINSRGEIVERVANRSNKEAAITRAEQLAR